MPDFDAERAKLFVLGKTRVGKGEFIQTAVHSLTGEVLDIASERMESDTKCATGYPATVNGKDMEIVDTVGYDDSNCGDLCEKEFLKLFASTGRGPYYPPLVVLREMSGSDMAWLERIRSVFPSIVCAVRCKTKAFKSAQNSCNMLKPSVGHVFHLHEFLDEDEDGGKTRKVYEQDVRKICEFYGSLTPMREKLNFDATIFQGDIEQIKTGSDTKTEERVLETLITKEDDVVQTTQKIVTIDDGGHYVDKAVGRYSQRLITGPATFYNLGSGGFSETMIIQEWVKDKKEEVVTDSSIEKFQINLIGRSKIRFSLRQDHYEVWKVLAGGIRVFKENAKSQWEEIKREMIDIRYTRVRDKQ